jgi:peptidoglycan/LPS O-acetylase OafA/YrhL
VGSAKAGSVAAADGKDASPEWFTTPVPPGSSRRNDIQGLRAIAVLTVVAFHAGIPFVGGGFVGVDIFFVISGFVITSALLRQSEQSATRILKNFYLGRVRRLMPALATLTLATTVVSLFVLSSRGPLQVEFKTAAAAMVASANIYISISSGGYFGFDAHQNPLLHTWSLSNEEQFYFVLPSLLLALGVIGVRRRPTVRWGVLALLVVAATASFTFQLVASRQGSDHFGFYDISSRAWEYLVGVIVALLAHNAALPRSRSAHRVMGWLGLVAMLWGCFRLTEATYAEGTLLVPVLGTALLLAVTPSRSSLWPRDLLASPPVRLVGDWSYSIYLWHWPFIVLGKYLFPQAAHVGVLAAVLSFVPAIGSYYLIEERFRHRDRAPRGSRLRAATGRRILAPLLAAPIILSLALAGLSAHGSLPGQRADASTPPGDVGHDVYHHYVESTYSPCTPLSLRALAPEWNGFLRCQQSKSDGPVTMAVVGDSHAEHLFPGLAEGLPGENIAYFIQLCAGNFGSRDERSDICPLDAVEKMTKVLDYVEHEPSIEAVVLGDYWLGNGIPRNPLRRAVEALSAAGKRVVITTDTPAFTLPPEQCAVPHADTDPPPACTAMADSSQSFKRALADVVGGIPNVEVFDVWSSLCERRRKCSMLHDGALMYRDTNHLNLLGSRLVGGTIAREAELLADERHRSG